MEDVVRLRDVTCLAGNNALLSNVEWTVKKGDLISALLTFHNFPSLPFTPDNTIFITLSR